MSLEKLEARDAARTIEQLQARVFGEVLAGEAADTVMISREEFDQGVALAFDFGQRAAWNRAAGRRTCRVCGCWELDACESGCWWIEDDLCSACSDDQTPDLLMVDPPQFSQPAESEEAPMPDRRQTAFTPAQRSQLQALLAAGAVSRETAQGAAQLKECLPVVIGILRDKGWADSRTVKPKGGSQFTAYWLTEAGIAQAEAA